MMFITNLQANSPSAWMMPGTSLNSRPKLDPLLFSHCVLSLGHLIQAIMDHFCRAPKNGLNLRKGRSVPVPENYRCRNDQHDIAPRRSRTRQPKVGTNTGGSLPHTLQSEMTIFTFFRKGRIHTDTVVLD